jgi:hypothetical protein
MDVEDAFADASASTADPNAWSTVANTRLVLGVLQQSYVHAPPPIANRAVCDPVGT